MILAAAWKQKENMKTISLIELNMLIEKYNKYFKTFRDSNKRGERLLLDDIDFHVTPGIQDAYGEYLAGQFQELCRREIELSQECPWAYLSIELLRTRVRQKGYRYRVMAYGE